MIKNLNVSLPLMHDIRGKYFKRMWDFLDMVQGAQNLCLHT